MSPENYYKNIHTVGKYTTLTALALMICVPLFTTLYFGITMNWSLIIDATITLGLVLIPVSIIEVISFSPLLGSGGTYLSFVTGNVMNMKLPAATACQRMLNVEPGTDESEVVSVLAIGMSSITTTIIIALGVFILSPLVGYLSHPLLKPGVDNIMPALLGAMLMPHVFKSSKLLIVPLIFALIAGYFINPERYGLIQGYLLAGCIVFSVMSNLFLFKNKKS